MQRPIHHPPPRFHYTKAMCRCGDLLRLHVLHGPQARKPYWYHAEGNHDHSPDPVRYLLTPAQRKHLTAGQGIDIISHYHHIPYDSLRAYFGRDILPKIRVARKTTDTVRYTRRVAYRVVATRGDYVKIARASGWQWIHKDHVVLDDA